MERLRGQQRADRLAAPLAARLSEAIAAAREASRGACRRSRPSSPRTAQAGEEMAGRLRECAAREAEIQAALRGAGETVTESEVAAQRLRDQAAEVEPESASVAERLGLGRGAASGAVSRSTASARRARGPRRAAARRRREQLGPVNPLAQDEYAEAIAHVEELEGQREDLETALRELRTLIRDTDRQIEETFEATFKAAARNFEELVGDVFPGGSGRLRLVEDEQSPPRDRRRSRCPPAERTRRRSRPPPRRRAEAQDPAQERFRASR